MIITEAQALNEGFFADKLGGVFDKIKAMLNTEVDVEAVGRKQSEAMQQVERDLKKAGIDTAKMKATIQRNVDAMDQNALRECMGVDGSQLLSEGFKERAEEIINQTFLQTFKDVYSELKSKSGDEITMGLMILIVIFVVQLLASAVILNILLIAGTPLLAAKSITMAFMAVFIAPVTEEYGRWYALQNNVGVSGFTATINVFEFIGYSVKIVMGGGRILGAITLRTLAALMHHFVTAVQIRGFSKGATEKKPKPGLNSFLIAVAIHAAWNLLAVVFQVPIAKLIGIKTENADILDDDLLLATL
jgi:hypothetical protein